VSGSSAVAAARAATTLGSASRRDRVTGYVFLGFLLFSLGIGFVALGALLVDVLVDGVPSFGEQVLTNSPSIDPEKAGARPAIIASLYLGLLIIAFSVPLGVGTAIYLEEYAHKERWYNRLLEVNIQNLAAVPSIVYGILGLAFIVRGIGVGRVVLAGAIILTLVVLPTVIVAAREAIRAVPDSIRQGAFALGATKWQVVRRQVLPAAIPGIATGSILAVSRGLGETAPLLLVGALTFVSVNPTILGSYTALPIQIFQWIQRPQEEFHFLAAAAIMVLLIMLLLLNGFAIWLRNRYRIRW
jgi:phosphate transport system permease protein